MTLNKTIKVVLPTLFVSAFFPLPSFAAHPLDIVINEICWMGNKISSNNEWLELYNNTNSKIKLEGWKLTAEDNTPIIELEGKIKSKSFFLLERTNDKSVPGIPADFIYQGSLKNEGEVLRLIDNQGNLIDEINCSSGWFKGENATKQTMARINPWLAGSERTNWQTSQNPGGTPKAKNDQIKKLTLTNQKETLNTIFLNEILPSPEGPDDQNEYIEIFNKGKTLIDLSGWSLQDIKGSTKIFILPEKSRIKANGFLLLSRKETKITLNNNGDGLKLLGPDKKIVDEVYYERANQGESLNRTMAGWQWSSILTPGAKNIISETNKIGIKEKEKNEKTAKVNRPTINLAEIITREQSGEKFSQNFFFVFLTALGLSILSAVIIITLKRKLKRKIVQKRFSLFL